MARLMLSAGMLTDLALSTAVLRRGLELGSPPPIRAAIDISRMILVKILPRLASRAPFLCLMEAHLECPDMLGSPAVLERDGRLWRPCVSLAPARDARKKKEAPDA